MVTWVTAGCKLYVPDTWRNGRFVSVAPSRTSFRAAGCRRWADGADVIEHRPSWNRTLQQDVLPLRPFHPAQYFQTSYSRHAANMFRSESAPARLSHAVILFLCYEATDFTSSCESPADVSYSVLTPQGRVHRALMEKPQSTGWYHKHLRRKDCQASFQSYTWGFTTKPKSPECKYTCIDDGKSVHFFPHQPRHAWCLTFCIFLRYLSATNPYPCLLPRWHLRLQLLHLLALLIITQTTLQQNIMPPEWPKKITFGDLLVQCNDPLSRRCGPESGGGVRGQAD